MQTFSDNYADLNTKMHNRPKGFGRDGVSRVAHFLTVAIDYHPKTVLDYGAGQGTFKDEYIRVSDLGETNLNLSITNYDPAVERHNVKPEGVFDMVVCTDVLEHIEPEFLDNVLQEIWDYTGKAAYLLISCRPAKNILPDGRNAHLIQEDPQWWVDRIVSDIHPWKVVSRGEKPDKHRPGGFDKVILVLEK